MAMIFLIPFVVCARLALLVLFGNWMDHHNDGPTHTFSFEGTSPFTDNQAIQWSKEVLISDGRFSPDLELLSSDPNPELSKAAHDVSRGDDPAFVSVYWFDKKTYRYWSVQIHRLDGKVEAISSPGSEIAITSLNMTNVFRRADSVLEWQYVANN